MQQSTGDKLLKFFVDQVTAYDREAKTWESRSKKIVKRYKDARGDLKGPARFNILWSNVQTLHPALYDGAPTPNVDRRFEDDEEVNTTVAQILERSASYFVKTNDFDDCLNQAVLDRLLPGRGTTWVRYVPNFKDVQVTGNTEVKRDGAQVTDDVVTGEDAEEELYSEDVVLDYVHWQDFGHSVCRTWQENRLVWRKVYLDKAEVKKRFPQTCMAAGQFIVPLDAKPLGRKEDDKSEGNSKCTIIELWDRVTKKVYWFHAAMDKFLDELEDPLRITGFFPCPKPIYSTLANDTLIPTPDFILYQDQANELDILTGRIDMLNKALKVVGVYDASAEGVQRMLSENMDNRLIPVEQWAVFAEKGGLKGVVDYFPIEMVANVLIQLYEARDRTKQDIYEITGISDIIRGATDAGETATAQKIKGQYATLRLNSMQKEVARFSRDCVRIMTEIIAEHFSLDTLKEVSGVRLLTEAEKQQVMMSQQPQPGPDGQPMPPQPLPEHIEKMLKKPTWEQVEAVLRENGARCFRIDIETDSTIKADQEAEKAARTEFLTAAGSFIQQAATIQSPELQPLLMRMLEFGAGGFKISRELETDFKVASDALKAKAEQPPTPPPPDPAIEKLKLEGQIKQEESQAKRVQMQEDSVLKRQAMQETLALKREEMQGMLQIKKEEAASSLAMKDQELKSREQLDMKKAFYEAKGKLPESLALTDPDLNGGRNPFEQVVMLIQQGNEQTQAMLIQIAQQQQENTDRIVEAATRKKTVTVKRDKATGRMQSADVA